MVNAGEQGVQAQQWVEKHLGQILQGVDFRWKKRPRWETCEWKRHGKAFVLNEKKRETARVRTQGPLPAKRWRVQKKRKKKKKKKGKETGKGHKEELVEEVGKKGSPASLRRRGEKKWESKAGRVTGVPERDKSWRNLEDGSFSLCCWGITGIVSTLQQKDCRRGRR